MSAFLSAKAQILRELPLDIIFSLFPFLSKKV
jgi:hypothetical protein